MTPGESYKPLYTNSRALIIGINAYSSGPLDFAKHDAEGMAEILETRFGFPKANIALLVDGAATRAAIMKSFMKFASDPSVTADDRIVVFYAGHGTTISGSRGEVGFLVPVDGSRDDLSTLIKWSDLTQNADLIPAKHIFFLMDACYGGLALTRQPSFGAMRFLKDMLQRGARQVLTAGKANETVADGSGVRPGHSIFTAHLLNGLEGGAATSGGLITASGVMAYVYDRVSKDQHSKQTPHFGFLDGDGDFIFDTGSLAQIESGVNDGTKGEDLLVNTSPQMPSAPVDETPISDTLKEYLSDPTKKIKLNDFVLRHVKDFLDKIDLRHFPVQTPTVTKEDFLERVNKYEELAAPLQTIAILLALWGDTEELLLLEKIFVRIAEADKGSSGKVVWINLPWYPIQYLMYSAGIAAISAQRFDALKVILETKVRIQEAANDPLPLVVAVSTKLGDIAEQFKLLPGHERHYVPKSEHLFKILQPQLEDALFLGRSYEELFDRMEVFAALICTDNFKGMHWGPLGRFGWKQTSGIEREKPFDHLCAEAETAKADWKPLRAGLFKSSYERFSEVVNKYREIFPNLNWF